MQVFKKTPHGTIQQKNNGSCICHSKLRSRCIKSRMKQVSFILIRGLFNPVCLKCYHFNMSSTLKIIEMIYILFFAGGWVCGEGANEVFEVPGIFYTYSTSPGHTSSASTHVWQAATALEGTKPTQLRGLKR